MSKSLTPGQAGELHKSIVAYLASINLSSTAAILQEQLGLVDAFDATTSRRYEGLLEKKWTSVVRLQKKSHRPRDGITTPPHGFLNYQHDTRFTPHRNPVTSVSFHPTYTSLASGSEDTTIKIWDWELGELERTLKGHTRAVTDVDFGGPTGRTLLASCSTDLTIRLWDPSNEYSNVRTLFGHDHSVSAVRFLSSSGNLVSASRDGSLRIWDSSTGNCVRTIRGHSDWIRVVSPSFDGYWLVSGGNDRTAIIWDTSTGEAKARLTGHENYVECCAFAPLTSYGNLAILAGRKKAPSASNSAEYVATGARDKSIKLWDAQGVLIKTLIGHDNWVRGLAFHPGGKYLLSVSDDKSLSCWDLSQDYTRLA